MVTSEEEGDLFGRETVCDSTLGLTELPAGELLLQKVKLQQLVLFVPFFTTVDTTFKE